MHQDNLEPARLLSPWVPQARILEWVYSPGDLPDPGIESRSPALQVDSLIEVGGILRVANKPTSDFLSKSAQGSVPGNSIPVTQHPFALWVKTEG